MNIIKINKIIFIINVDEIIKINIAFSKLIYINVNIFII